jgi:hypothetical protein
MSLRFQLFGALFLCLALGSLTACHSGRRSPTGPSPFAGSFGAPAPFGFEPATLRPELVNGTSCVSFRPFSTRIIIVVSPGSDVILRSLHFRFTDRFGVSALPSVSSNLTTGPIPPLGVAPLPTSAPVQIPGSSPINGFMVPAGSSQRLPFLLTFGCGVSDTGLLVVSVDSADMRGRLQTSQLDVRVMQ